MSYLCQKFDALLNGASNSYPLFLCAIRSVSKFLGFRLTTYCSPSFGIIVFAILLKICLLLGKTRGKTILINFFLFTEIYKLYLLVMFVCVRN